MSAGACGDPVVGCAQLLEAVTVACHGDHGHPGFAQLHDDGTADLAGRSDDNGLRAVGHDFACRQAHLGRVQAYETPDSITDDPKGGGIDSGNKNQRSDARDGSVHRVKFVELVGQVVDEIPDVGRHFRSTHDAEVDRVPVWPRGCGRSTSRSSRRPSR